MIVRGKEVHLSEPGVPSPVAYRQQRRWQRRGVQMFDLGLDANAWAYALGRRFSGFDDFLLKVKRLARHHNH
jgi:hypothetical protein